MKWKKLGLIFKPTYNFEWMNVSSWVPTAEHIEGDIFKVYFGSRNKNNLSQTGFFTFNINDLDKIIEVSKEPIIKLGELGSFDDSLALATTFVEYKDVKYLYYVGWMQGKRVRYYPSIGLATSQDNGKTFKKHSAAPIMNRTNEDPFGMASPFVMEDNGLFRMWYASYRRWDLRDGDPWPQYQIRYAESIDGFDWKIKNIICLGSDTEEAVARPYIIKKNNKYLMWYCYRLQYGPYRIGYAESNDGIKWDRMDHKVGIDVSKTGWDSEMIEYPCVFDHNNERYMLYNGNTFGVDGIGLAILEH
jgi:predicted GH43/DUF377 family glycosyl hydrolase